MPTVLIRDPLTTDELRELEREFPHFDYRVEIPQNPIAEDDWGEVEVLYGQSISPEELEHAHRLRWIHVPTARLGGLCLEQIESTTNIFVTCTKDPDTHQAAEYAIGAILAYSKNLYDFRDGQGDPKGLWDSPFRDLIWSLQGRTLLQIGLGAVGTSIAAACETLGMRVWGLHDPPSFHPNCKKVFPYRDLHSLLGAADVVCVSARWGHIERPLLGRTQLELMRPDAILVVLGTPGLIDASALHAVAGKFRGVALDIPLDWKRVNLSEHPNVLITPEISSLPAGTERLTYRLFLYNFRRFIHNDFPGMRGGIELAEIQPTL